MPRGIPKKAKVKAQPVEIVEFSETEEVKGNITTYKKNIPSSVEKVDQAALMMNSLFKDNIVIGSFDDIPQNLKIALLMNLPKSFVKSRKIGKAMIPYIPHEISEKCINFIFGYRWKTNLISCEVTHHAKFYEVSVVMEFEAELNYTSKQHGYTIKRTVASGCMHPKHAGTNEGHAKQSAISRCNTVFLKQMGVGTNLSDIEDSGYKKAKEQLKKDGEFSEKDLDTSNFTG